VGFDWSRIQDAVAKVDEELAETRKALRTGDQKRIQEEIGDLLFAVVNVSRFRKINAEEALDGTAQKFIRRFREVECRIRKEGKRLGDCSLAEMDAHWESIKKEEKRPRKPKRLGRNRRRPMRRLASI
jgi:uncharacterized protein YabN with tetrapyrrole methylase and pyrophosphatase domain